MADCFDDVHLDGFVSPVAWSWFLRTFGEHFLDCGYGDSDLVITGVTRLISFSPAATTTPLSTFTQAV
jgi:hypothetical protein